MTKYSNHVELFNVLYNRIEFIKILWVDDIADFSYFTRSHCFVSLLDYCLFYIGEVNQDIYEIPYNGIIVMESSKSFMFFFILLLLNITAYFPYIVWYFEFYYDAES